MIKKFLTSIRKKVFGLSFDEKLDLLGLNWTDVMHVDIDILVKNYRKRMKK